VESWKAGKGTRNRKGDLNLELRESGNGRGVLNVEIRE
jgi:hypothetical protein